MHKILKLYHQYLSTIYTDSPSKSLIWCPSSKYCNLTKALGYNIILCSSLSISYIMLQTLQYVAHGKSKALERSKVVPLHIARQGLLLSGIHWAASPPVKQQQMNRKSTIKLEERDAMLSPLLSTCMQSSLCIVMHACM